MRFIVNPVGIWVLWSLELYPRLAILNSINAFEHFSYVLCGKAIWSEFAVSDRQIKWNKRDFNYRFTFRNVTKQKHPSLNMNKNNGNVSETDRKRDAPFSQITFTIVQSMTVLKP